MQSVQNVTWLTCKWNRGSLVLARCVGIRGLGAKGGEEMTEERIVDVTVTPIWPMEESDNNDCGIAAWCKDCNRIMTNIERSECHAAHLRWLTEPEMDAAIAELWTPRLQKEYEDGFLSYETKRPFAIDAVRAAQDAKTWRIAQGARK